MEFIFKTPPTLQQTAMVKIMAEMWSRDDFKGRIAELDRLIFPFYSNVREVEKWNKWSEIESRVARKVSAFHLPETLKDLLKNIIKPIGLEILSWWYVHNVNNKIMPNHFVWTARGTLDHKKTAEGMVKDEHLDLETRFVLACIYCLEDDVRGLWNRIPEERKTEMYSKIKLGTALELTNKKDLVAFWTHTVLGEVDELVNLVQRRRSDCSPNEFAYECAADGGLLAATEFFFEKLRLEGINSNKFNLIDHVHFSLNSMARFPYVNTGVPYFLLNQMSEDQQTLLFSRSFHRVLELLLYWPWQDLFMETARRFWYLMNDDMYDKVLGCIVRKISDGFKDYGYKALFKDVWKMGSPTLKEPQFSEYRVVNYLSCFFEVKEMDLIETIFNDTTAAQMEDFIFYHGWIFQSKTLIGREEWDLIKYLIDQCFITEETIAKCKIKILSDLQRLDEESKVKCKKFLRFADDLTLNKK